MGINNLGKEGYPEAGHSPVPTKGAIIYWEGQVPKAKSQRASMHLEKSTTGGQTTTGQD